MSDLIVVADRTEARLYGTQESDGSKRLVELAHLRHPEGRLRPRQIASDRPGRVFARASGGAGPASTRRGGTEGETDPREAELERFVRSLLALVTVEHRRLRAGVVLVAGPRLLGVLRSLLPAALAHAVTHEVRKDYLHATEEQLLGILRRSAAVPPSRPAGSPRARSSRRTVKRRRVARSRGDD
ncbi:MAG: host attachment protein [Steroidobacteraceae bacterium]